MSDDTHNDARERADRISEKVSILQVLIDYGYDVQDYDVPQQFRCDLHGSGMDNKPSARVYPQDNHWYCFGCGEQRDAIATVKDKESVEFWEACGILESRYNLPAWKSTYRPPPKPKDPREVVAVPDEGCFKDDRKRTESLLMSQTRGKDLSMSKLLSLWEEFSKIDWNVRQEIWTEKEGRQKFAEMRDQVIALAARAV